MNCERCGAAFESEMERDALAGLGGVCVDCWVAARFRERVEAEIANEVAEKERNLLKGDGGLKPKGLLSGL